MYQAKLPAQSPDTNQSGSGKIRLHALLTLWGSRLTSLKAGFISASRTGTSWKNLSFHDYSTGGRSDVSLNEHIFLLLKSWRTHCFITSHLGKAHLPKSPVASYLTTHYLQKSGWLWEAGKIKFKERLNEPCRTKVALYHVWTQAGKQKNWVPIPELPQTSFVILGKRGNIQRLQSPLGQGSWIISSLWSFQWGVCELYTQNYKQVPGPLLE